MLSQLRHGSRLVVAAILPGTSWNEEIFHYEIALNHIPQSNVLLEIPINANERLFGGQTCGEQNGIEAQLLLYVENDLSSELLNANTEIGIEDICFQSKQLLSRIDLAKDLQVQVIPNPTAEGFYVTLKSLHKRPVHIQVFDQFAQSIERNYISPDQKTIYIGESWAPALYYLKLTSGEETVYQRLLKVNK